MDVGRSFEQINTNKKEEKNIEFETLKGHEDLSLEQMRFSVRGTIPWMSPELK
jgi:hypothetical protein